MISVRSSLSFILLLVVLFLPFSAGAQSIDGLQVDESGQVGVGTSSPSYQLDVEGGDVQGHTFRPKRGYFFPNQEEYGFQAGYKSSGYTYMLWDRNNAGGPFTTADRPQFFYWDADSGTLRYLIDSGNMKNLNARFASLDVGGDATVEGDARADGLTFRNRETEGYKDTYKSDDHTHLMWDRNNGGGPFGGGGCPQFAYWDNDAGTLRYLLDSCNMRYLDARFSSVDVEGNVSADTLTATTVEETSARRFKTDVKSLEDATALVEALRGVRYRWKASGELDVGFIAEEVEEVLPSLVSHTGDGKVKGLNYSHLTAVLAEALKEQARRADRLQRQLKKRKRRDERQKARLDRQQRQIEALRSALQQAGIDVEGRSSAK